MKILSFFKREIVLTLSLILAIISGIAIPPDAAYLRYIDFRTLGILFCLMSVMAGLRELGFFSSAAKAILRRTKNLRQMIFILVLLCFFSSMIITNDVALITFVPLSIIMLEFAGGDSKRRWMIFTVVMQTIAANLGSMLTPIGNPQNLYLYSVMGNSIGTFILLMLPYTLISLVGLILCIWFATRKETRSLDISLGSVKSDSSKLLLYAALFTISLLVVLRVLDYRLVLVVTLISLLTLDRKTLFRVDYTLLMTFITLFIFIGNIGRIPAFRQLLEKVINGREMLTGVICSQVISNVPAALLLSGFTEQFRELTIGVNIGGLGTLIASMASLISFKYIAKDSPSQRGKYLLHFTLYNIGFLILLLPFTLIF